MMKRALLMVVAAAAISAPAMITPAAAANLDVNLSLPGVAGIGLRCAAAGLLRLGPSRVPPVGRAPRLGARAFPPRGVARTSLALIRGRRGTNTAAIGRLPVAAGFCGR